MKLHANTTSMLGVAAGAHHPFPEEATEPMEPMEPMELTEPMELSCQILVEPESLQKDNGWHCLSESIWIAASLHAFSCR